MMSDDCDFTFIVSMNQDDATMNNEVMQEFLNKFDNLAYFYGTHSSKIVACNADIVTDDWDIVILVSDDMIPVVKDFDKIITGLMEDRFPDTNGALHFNDGCCGKDQTITFSILGYALYKHLGYIYHPDYKSFYCDNEFTDVVRALKVHHYDPRVIVEHKWGGWGDPDQLYRLNHRKGVGDQATYERRKKEGFPNA